MRRKMERRMLAVGIFLLLFAGVINLRLYAILDTELYRTAGTAQGRYTVRAGTVNGQIYDRNLEKLVHRETVLTAVVNPTPEAIALLTGHALDPEVVRKAIPKGKPFVCQVDTAEIACDDIAVFETPVRYGADRLAAHVIGYVQNGAGVSGLEASYDTFLREQERSNIVTYSVNGQGGLLEGMARTVQAAEPMTAGVVTTLDARIQSICESAAAQMPSGAVVVLEVETGEVLAMVSTPVFDAVNLAASLEDSRAPFLNRALCAYSVGSVFKIVTAATALQNGIPLHYMHVCDGKAQVGTQSFRCHDRNGHGLLDMAAAMTHSCNTYFISLSQALEPEAMRRTADAFGFGRPTVLADGITGAAGNLPDLAALSVPAERANFSFGQGKLTATPIQVAMMTCAVANNGSMPLPNLVRGVTEDGFTITGQRDPGTAIVMSEAIARQVQILLTAAVQDNPASKARPDNTTAAGKTSTAQTGQYAPDGTEYCHAWMTGYFPVEKPKYVVTVFVENGGSGNTAAAPVFREIAEKITNGD